jgi:hypothetical protein
MTDLETMAKDAKRLAAFAEFAGASFGNKYCVQVRPTESVVMDWQLVYYAAPPSGTPKYMAASRLDALREAIDAVTAKLEQAP